MNALLGHLANKNGTFRFVQSSEYEHYRLTDNEQKNLENELVGQTRKDLHRTLIYERHFYFTKFVSSERKMFFYMNQIRDPLKRALSYYDYVRYVCHVHRPDGFCSLANRSLQNLTMEQCVQTGDPRRCLTNGFGVRSAIPFFCGQLSFCDDSIDQMTNQAALNLAKQNIEQHYFHVGILEYFENSLELLEFNQPIIFKGITEIYRNTLNRSLVHETPRTFRHPISDRTQTILRDLLKFEYELYDFVKQRFISEYTRTFERPPRRTRK